MQIGILYYMKFEFNSEYKAIFNCTMPYVVVLIIINFQFLKNLENN